MTHPNHELPPDDDTRPTITKEELQLRQVQAGLNAAQSADEHEPRLVEALLCGATGKPFRLRNLTFQPMTAGMLFTLEELRAQEEQLPHKIGYWANIALRAWVHHDAEGVWSLMKNNGRTLADLLPAAQELLRGLDVTELQTLAGWLAAEQLRWQDPSKAKEMAADLAREKQTPPKSSQDTVGASGGFSH